MFKFFEGLVDPYAPYTQTDTPPRQLWPFLADYIRPFRKVFAVTALFSTLNAASEVGLLWYLGHLVDLLGQGTPAAVWAAHRCAPLPRALHRRLHAVPCMRARPCAAPTRGLV
jgi:ATP-binding cassette subfamily B multidrug efflux pump